MTVAKLMYEYDKDDLCRMEAAQLGSYLAHAIGSHESVPYTVALMISMQNYVEEQVDMFAEAFNGTRKLGIPASHLNLIEAKSEAIGEAFQITCCP